MVEIKLKDKQSGYDAIGEYIRRYWQHNAIDTVIVLFATSYNGNTYEFHKEVACPCNYDDIEFFYDWWGAKSSSNFLVSNQFKKSMSRAASMIARLRRGLYEKRILVT